MRIKRFIWKEIKETAPYFTVTSAWKKNVSSKPNKSFTKRYQTKEKLNNHFKVHERERLDCKYCEAGSMTLKELASHYELYLSETICHKCNICDFKSQFVLTLRKHSANIHGKNALGCILEGCDYSCKWSFTTAAKEHYCGVESCKYKSSSKYYLRKHKEKKHFITLPQCDKCGLYQRSIVKHGMDWDQQFWGDCGDVPAENGANKNTTLLANPCKKCDKKFVT